MPQGFVGPKGHGAPDPYRIDMAFQKRKNKLERRTVVNRSEEAYKNQYTPEQGFKRFVTHPAEIEARVVAGEADAYHTTKEMRGRPPTPASEFPNMKKGGRIKKTGNYKLHKGEHVFSRDQVRDLAAKLQM